MTRPGEADGDRAADGGGGFARNSSVMAVGTALSRLTGLLRLVALVYAVHFRALADAYNLANTMPNVVHDVVLGGIVSATFVPVFVSRLAAERDEDAWLAISAVTSVTLVVICVAAIAFVVAAPFIVDGMTALNHSARAATERHVATYLLILFVPQLACYGCISVATALLNARRRFAAPMFAPIANNVVVVFALLAFGTVVRDPTLGGVYQHRGQLLLLGLGTTVGVFAQLLAMLPSLRRADLHLRWYPRVGHEAVRRVVRLSGWTVGLVLTNQVALIVVLALSVRAGQGAVSAYTYAYTFFQLPYGVVAVSIMSAVGPELAHRFTRGDLDGFRRRMDSGLRSMLVLIVPAAAAMVILAKPLLELLGHMIGHPASTDSTAVALAMLSLGLPGFCVFLYVVRVLQSMQDLRTAFWLYLLENAVNVVAAVALAPSLGVRGIALSIAVAYTAAAVVGLARLRALAGGLDRDRLVTPLRRVVACTAVLVVGTVLGTSVTDSESASALLGRVALGAVLGIAGYVLAAALAAHRRRGPTRHDPAADGDESETSGGRRRPRPKDLDSAARVLAAAGGRRRRRAAIHAPPPPERLPPAGRPPLRPHHLGPTRPPGDDGDDGGGQGRGRLGR